MFVDCIDILIAAYPVYIRFTEIPIKCHNAIHCLRISDHPGYPGAHPGIKDPAVYDKWAREHKKQGLARFLPESAIQVMKAWLFKNVMVLPSL